MDLHDFQSLLKYYLTCMDMEEASQLQLWKNQEGKTYIFAGKDGQEKLFTQDLPQLDIPVTDPQKKFITHRAASAEALPDLLYGFPVYADEKDMLTPLFIIAVEPAFATADTLRLLPKVKSITVNRLLLFKKYETEDIDEVCEELEGEFGSFDARLKAAKAHLSFLPAERWLDASILFRANFNPAKAGLRYELGRLLKDANVLSEDTALKYFVQGGTPAAKAAPPRVLEIAELNLQQEEAVLKGLREPLSVITGPPGTGKTQVVAALLASAAFSNKTVLFASNNNMPVDGVYDRLGKSTGELGNWLMRLGNREKRAECQQAVSALLQRVQASGLLQPGLVHETEKFAEVDGKIARMRAALEKAQIHEESIGRLCALENDLTRKLFDGWPERITGHGTIQACGLW